MLLVWRLCVDFSWIAASHYVEAYDHRLNSDTKNRHLEECPKAFPILRCEQTKAVACIENHGFSNKETTHLF